MQNEGKSSSNNCSLFIKDQKFKFQQKFGSFQGSVLLAATVKVWAEPFSFRFRIICQTNASWSQHFGGNFIARFDQRSLWFMNGLWMKSLAGSRDFF